MGLRSDQQPWQESELAIVREDAPKRFSADQCADHINAAVWGGMRVRTGAAVARQRMNMGIRMSQMGVGEVSAKVSAKIAASPSVELSANPAPVEVQNIEIREDGDVLHVTARGTEVRTFEELIARSKIDMRLWEMDKPSTRTWETTMRDADGKIRKVQNFYLSTTFKRKHGPNVAEQVEALIAGAFAKRKPRPTINQKLKVRANPDLMQAVVIADPHLAKFAWGKETGWEDYDLFIGSRLLRQATDALTEWGDQERPAVRHIWLLGDQLQYDTPQGTTTGGTPQDRDSRLAKMLMEAQSAFCHAIERSAATCPTKVTVIGGNHDRSLSVALQMILAAWFRHDSRVEVDLGSQARKYVEWGRCLIGLTHGDTARKKLPNLMQVERREAWGKARCAEWHHGHFHREAQTVTEGGVTIREHLALCPPDGWHSAEGYVGAPRGMDSLLYDAVGCPVGWRRHTILHG